MVRDSNNRRPSFPLSSRSRLSPLTAAAVLLLLLLRALNQEFGLRGEDGTGVSTKEDPVGDTFRGAFRLRIIVFWCIVCIVEEVVMRMRFLS